ncbi:hypothetical protein [Streptomyces cinereoruber]|uniref:hypothetical protein n=1 Tax=Streptomyces cinereoruber TaxID=67260 RepID=UPI00362E8866
MPVTLYPKDLPLVIENAEIAYITDVDGDQITVTRAQEGTTAKEVATGWGVIAAITAKSITDIEDEVLTKAPASDLALKANDNAVVHLTGNETVAGVKTFSSSPIVPTPTTSTEAANKTYVDSKTGGDIAIVAADPDTSIAEGIAALIANKAENSAVVHFSGTETITGDKRFNGAFGLNVTPTTQQTAATDLGSVLSLFGFRASGSTYTLQTSGLIKMDGGVRLTSINRTANQTLSAASPVNNLCNATTAAFAITLPTAVGIAGQTYMIKKTDVSSNAVTVQTTSSQTIDGSTTYVLASQYKYVTVISDGSNWMITGNN